MRNRVTFVLGVVLANDRRVNDAKTWCAKRRPEIVRMFEDVQFDRAPAHPADTVRCRRPGPRSCDSCSCIYVRNSSHR